MGLIKAAFGAAGGRSSNIKGPTTTSATAELRGLIRQNGRKPMNRKRSFCTFILSMLIIMSTLVQGGCKTDLTHVSTTEELLEAIQPGA